MADMNKSIAIAAQIKQGLANFNDPEVKEYFIEKYAPGATDIELAEYISTCQADDAVPGRDIFFVKYKNRKTGGYYPATFIHSVHWMTRKANESGDFVGFTEPSFLDKDGNWHEGHWPFDQKIDPPVACKIGLIRKSTDKIAWSTVRWAEKVKMYNGKPSDFWGTMGVEMLEKCTVAKAYRRSGFVGLTDRYISEEMKSPEAEWTPSTETNAVEAGREAAKRVDREKRVRAADLGPDKMNLGQKKTIMAWSKASGHAKLGDAKSSMNAILKAVETELPMIESVKDITHDQAEVIVTSIKAQEADQGEPDLSPDPDSDI